MVRMLYSLEWSRPATPGMIAPNAAATARFGVPDLKAAMYLLGYYGGPPRSPLLPLNDTQRGALRAILVEAGLLPQCPEAEDL